jgi:inorganic pyrophosphatase
VSAAEVFPAELELIVEVPRWNLVKPRDDGSIAFISPLPCPFNYGSVPDTLAADGCREDVVLLGPRVRAGSRVRARVVGRVRFLDAGVRDDKWVCSARELSASDRVFIGIYFRVYACLKRAFYALRGASGQTRYSGVESAGSPWR